MLKLYVVKLFKNFIALKLLFGGLSCALIFQEFKVYFFDKPTYTSVSKVDISKSKKVSCLKPDFSFSEFDHYPDMTICATPSFHSDKLKQHGYHASYYYAKGIPDYTGKKLLGWVGNISTNNMESVTEDIVTMHNISDCPSMRVKFNKNGDEWQEYLKMTFTRVMHPNGRCCKAIVPENASSATISTIFLLVHPYPDANPVGVKGFQLFLSNRKSANDFHRKKFAIDGYPLIAEAKDLGYSFFNLKIHETVYPENSEEYLCKHYKSVDGYGDCLSDVYLSQSLEVLNCTAPWLTAKEDLWCRKYLELSDEVSDRFGAFLASVVDDRNEQKHKCLPPCHSSW